MTLSDPDLALIRDEVGDTPSDDELFDMYDDLASGSWIPTALRVLRRRRAALAGQEVKNVTLPGGLGVGLSSNMTSLDRQITRLEKALVDWELEQAGPCETVAASSRIHRQTYRSG